MASEESYNLNEEHSEDEFDPEDSAPPGPRGRIRQNINYGAPREQNQREGRRQTRGIRNINYSQAMRVDQTDGHENVPQRVAYGQVDDDQDDDQEGQRQDDKEPESVFSPNIDVILWKRQSEGRSVEYLVKYKNRSYLHLDWLPEEELLQISKSAKNKLNRFNKGLDKKTNEPVPTVATQEVDEETGEEKYFDASYVEVDRVIATTEIFPVVHQKKANEIRGKWSESISLVCEKLLNFSRDHIHYGVFFSEPVNPQRDNCPNYRKVIQTPMDLGTILNRILLDNYKQPLDFWKDVGLVWRNCRKFNQGHESDIKLIGDTLRQASICLYRQWHRLTTERYEALREEFAKQAKVKQTVVDDSLLADLLPHTGEDQRREHKIKSSQPEQVKKQVEAESEPKQNGNTEVHSEQQEEKQQVQQQISEENKTEPKPESLNENGELEAQEVADQLEPTENNLPKDIEDRVSSEREAGKDEPEIEEEEEIEYFKQTCKNVFIERRKADTPNTEADLEKYNPGPFSFQWILDEGETDEAHYENYSYTILDQYDLKALNLNIEVDRLYLVKWKNLSYTQATWEQESSIFSVGGQVKITEFRAFNRALDKEGRMNMLNQNQRHKTLVEIESNPRKKARLGQTSINEIRSKLYFLDIRTRKHPNVPQYTPEAPPAYRDYKLLRDYQLESLNWLISSWYHNRNVILADEMGLGKTIQSIAFLQHLWSIETCRGPFLVIAPLSTLEHWKRTVEEWTNLNCVLYYDHNGQAGRASIRYYEWNYIDISTKGSIIQSADLHKFHVLITSFEVFLADFQNIMLKVPFQFIVVDEAHRLKNQNAKILQCLRQLPCKRVLLLTGTPIQNNTDELWSLLNYIEPERFGKREDFRKEFGDLASSEQIQKLHTLLKPYLLRRMKEDVEQSIPPLQETIIDIEMTNLQKTIYRALYERNKGMLTKGFAGSAITTSLNNLEMQLRKCCNHPFLIKEIEAELMKECKTEDERINKILESSGKMTLVNKLLDKYRAEEKKVLIFSQFTYMLALLEELLKHKGVKYEKIDGQIKAKERQNSIDRYNNREKKREVFLLSTKAGGIGINLTSANIVIIFDSDWNPQNDVQATARAHRIGQRAEVQVFRLVTAKTYESEMFERAARKLGLDQAIFIDGTFKTTKNEDDAEERRHGKKEKVGRTDKTKLSKDELETLLRRGMIGLYEENMKNEDGTPRIEHGNTFYEDNVDDILERNSRLAKYSVIKGSYTFAKSRFVSDQSDNKLDLRDPNFWSIVLKNVESKSQKILKKLEDLSKFKALPAQQHLMWEVSECVNALVESKLSLSGYSAEDEKNLNDLLTLISTSKPFNRAYRDMASNWLDEVSKPSRRFRRMTLQDFDISGKPTATIGKTTRSKEEGYEMDKEIVFFDSERESEEGPDLTNPKVKVDEQKKDELLRKLCYLCQRPKCTFFCKDFCKRAFHSECKNRVEKGQMNLDGVEKVDVEELNMSEQALRDSVNCNYTCLDCKDHSVVCYICKVKGKYYGAEYHKKKTSSNNTSLNNGSVLRLVKKTEQNDDEVVLEQDPPSTQKIPATTTTATASPKKKNDVTKCSTANCAKFYHPRCIETFDGLSKFKYIDQKQLHFRCSLHYCFKCGDSGDTMAIAQCIRCPRAFHLRCMDKDKVSKVTKKLFICERHTKNKKKDNSKKPIKVQLLTKFTSSRSKYQSKPKPRDQDEDSEVMIEEPQRQTGTKRTRSILRKSEIAVKAPKLAPLPEVKKVAYTYEELGIQSPLTFDYSKYPEDWCRYCGARFSSNFTQGPWGPKTLCTVHYINWKKKRSLILEPYVEKPTTPINPHDDQELRYISSLKAKDPQVDIKTFLEGGGFQAYRKRMKKSFDSFAM